MNRELSKAFMTRTRLGIKFFKEKAVENRKKYNKQRNYCVALLIKANREYGSLDEKRNWQYKFLENYQTLSFRQNG